MTYREFIRSGLPPAPEPPELNRQRKLTMVACFSATVALVIARSLDNKPPALAVLSIGGGIVALTMLVIFWRRKFRHDLAYWTPEQVALHRGEPVPSPQGPPPHLVDASLLPPDRPLVH